jgi:arylsulfatase A-like enzyme
MFDPGYEGVMTKRFFSHQALRMFSMLLLSEREKEHAIALYDAETRYLDEEFGRIIKQMKALGIYDNTVIVLSSDHGDELWDHKHYGHGYRLYNELLHIPLMVKYPHGEARGRVKSRVRLIDVSPTILHLCGIRGSLEAEGEDLSRYVLNSVNRDLPVYAESTLYGPEKKSVMNGSWKLIVNRFAFVEREDQRTKVTDRFISPGGRMERIELYNIRNDPGEKIDLSGDYPDTVRALEDELITWLAETPGTQLSVESAVADEAVRERLKLLGYIQ